MLDMYYDTEQPLPLDVKVLSRKLLARSPEESQAVTQLLEEFFTETAQGWYHERCEQEIAEYHTSVTAKSAAGKASAAKREAGRIARLAELNGSSTPVQQVINECSTAVEQVMDSVDSSVQLTNNHKPITNNHEPLKEKAPAAPKYSEKDAIAELVALGVDAQVAGDWMIVRKGKGSKPNKTGINEALKNIADAGMTVDQGIRICCERGWAGFNKAWLPNAMTGAHPRAGPPYQTARDKAKAWADIATGQTNGNHQPQFIDLNPAPFELG
jgi:uncharacterized protein YdaU (DUF1376 family)